MKIQEVNLSTPTNCDNEPPATLTPLQPYSTHTNLELYQQHMLKNREDFSIELQDLNLDGLTVVELGVGTGELTKIISDRKPKKIIGYEIDPNIVPEELATAIELHIDDFTRCNLDIFKDPSVCLITNPPYNQLKFIKDQIIDKYNIKNVQIMAPASERSMFEEFNVIGEMDGSVFLPPSDGKHLILRKGFHEQSTERYNPEMVEQVKKQIQNPSFDQKYGTNRRVVLCLTENKNKIPEIKRNLSRYGIEVLQVPASQHPRFLFELLKLKVDNVKIMAAAREVTSLVVPKTELLAALNHLESVDHLSHLKVYRLQPSGITATNYEHRTRGFWNTTQNRKNDKTVFGWDDCFTIAKSFKTYHELRQKGLKVSSRDMVWGQYLKDYVYYSNRVDLHFFPVAPTSTIDFSQSMSTFLASHPLLNPKESPISNIFQHVAKEGVFLRSPINRREKNYWLPGLNAGIPLVPKKDAVHEATFMAHDLCHFLLPDLVVDKELTTHEAKVYLAYRMMSEAMTLVLADMVFVDSLKKSDIEYNFSARKIYPLFQATGLDLEKPTFLENLKILLHANMRYCLRGDDSEYRILIERNNADLQALENFKTKYSPFFVEDFRWTQKNIQSMASESHVFKPWWSDVSSISGKYNLGLKTVSQYSNGLSEDPDKLVEEIFERVFKDIIEPGFTKSSSPINEDQNRTKAFMRYMIGQMGVFYRFSDTPLAAEYSKVLQTSFLQHSGNYSIEEIYQIRNFYNQFIDQLSEENRIQSDDAATFKEVCPLFEPFFTFYDEDQAFYEDLKTISERLLG